MVWKPITTAPRDGTMIMIAREGGCIEFNARWGIHRNTGVERWVDGHGLGITGTYWDYPPEPPKIKVRPLEEDDGA